MKESRYNGEWGVRPALGSTFSGETPERNSRIGKRPRNS
jgi:hypothetical protein